MPSLKEISDQVANSLSRPFDDMLKERIKSIFRLELANYIRQQIVKYGIDTQFKTRYSIICTPVNSSDSSLDNAEVDRTCFRSVNKIAKPVRYNSDEPFTYVGSITGKYPYRYSPISFQPYEDYMPAVQKAYQVVEGETAKYITKWDYRNGYIYVYFTPALAAEEECNIMIEGVHVSYDFIGDETLESKTKSLVYLDTIEFPMPDDIVQLVKEKLLKTELSIVDDKDKVPPANIDNN